MTIFLCSPSLLPCIHCSLGILAGVRTSGAKHLILTAQLCPVSQGDRQLSTDFGNQKVPMEKVGLLSSQGFIGTGQAAPRKTLTGCKKNLLILRTVTCWRRLPRKVIESVTVNIKVSTWQDPGWLLVKTLLSTAVWTLGSDFLVLLVEHCPYHINSDLESEFCVIFSKTSKRICTQESCIIDLKWFGWTTSLSTGQLIDGVIIWPGETQLSIRSLILFNIFELLHSHKSLIFLLV